MKKIIWAMVLIVVALVAGCGKTEEDNTSVQELGDNQIYIYYVNLDKTDMVPAVYTLESQEDLTEVVGELIDNLTNVEITQECQTPIPSSITYVEQPIENVRGRIDIAFNVLMYDNINAEDMLFFKSCVCKTLLQLDGVNNVVISMTDMSNADPETATVTESYDDDSFILSYGRDKGYTQTGNIILYFANESGDALKEYRKTVEISNTTSLERVVVESLIGGPLREGYTATLPEDTVIQNIAVKDGICYLDLSEEFYNADNPLKNDIIVYSIVDSLIELPTVTKVQFLKNGEKIPFYRETLAFDGIFERNLDLIEQEDNNSN